jgi:hypothetical protein
MVALAFGATVLRAHSLGVDTHPPGWVVDAVPPALSQVVFGWDRHYTSLGVVSDTFREATSKQPMDAAHIDAAIARVQAIDRRVVGDQYELLGSDDKGIVDFVVVSFVMFGLHVERTLYLYFVVLGVSTGLFAVAFIRLPAYLLLVASFHVMLFLLLPAVAFNPQLGSPLALRAMPLLAMVACLHCILYLLRPAGTRWQLGFVVAQIALLTIVVHLRSTSIWEPATVFVMGLTLAVAPWLRQHRLTSADRRVALLRLMPALFVLVGQLGLAAYRTVGFPVEYQRGEQITTRVFWHNIFSGLAFQPSLAERYQLRVDDVSVIRATGQYLHEKGRDADWAAVGGTSPNFSRVRWAAYDPFVGEMLVDRCTRYWEECLSAALYYKPRSLIGQLEWLYGVRTLPPDLEVFVSPDVGDAVKQQVIDLTGRLDTAGLRAYLWTPAAFLLLAPFVVVIAASCQRVLADAWIASGVLLSASASTTIIGYPAPHTIADFAVAAGICVYLLLCCAAAFLLRVVRAA